MLGASAAIPSTESPTRMHKARYRRILVTFHTTFYRCRCIGTNQFDCRVAGAFLRRTKQLTRAGLVRRSAGKLDSGLQAGLYSYIVYLRIFSIYEKGMFI